ncbi:phytoene desaturase family protein [Paenarthrobacter nicotinovorans]|uniref:phytoene desaturase family protein n=1 Tax=Paenarthrobacter nicotinovorans TaxID=29320 RepID=UPI0009EE7DC5
MLDVAIVGAGPNGLAAAVILARSGLEVALYEANEQVGGALQSSGPIGPDGFRFDLGSSVHPFIQESEFFRQWRATERLDYVIPDISFAHPLPGGAAGTAYRDIEQTIQELGPDGEAWRRLIGPLSSRAHETSSIALNPALAAARNPRHLARLGARTLATTLRGMQGGFTGSVAPALLAGVMAHANSRMPGLATSSVGLVLTAMAHGNGWPLPLGGSGRLSNALAEDFVAHGGQIVTGSRIRHWGDLEPARATIFNTSLASAAAIAGDRLPARYRKVLERKRSGSGVFKVDYLTSEAVPWSAATVKQTPTVHVGGSATEIAAAENAVSRGVIPEHPYVLLVQPTVVDPDRCVGKTIVSAYCHVPNGSAENMSDRITRQVERFAPGFRDTILFQASSDPAALERGNANLSGGDIGGGSLAGLNFINRPRLGPHPWRTPTKDIYISSSYVAPGPGTHCMGGYHAAKDILRGIFGVQIPNLAP